MYKELSTQWIKEMLLCWVAAEITEMWRLVVNWNLRVVRVVASVTLFWTGMYPLKTSYYIAPKNQTLHNLSSVKTDQYLGGFMHEIRIIKS